MGKGSAIQAQRMVPQSHKGYKYGAMKVIRVVSASDKDSATQALMWGWRHTGTKDVRIEQNRY